MRSVSAAHSRPCCGLLTSAAMRAHWCLLPAEVVNGFGSLKQELLGASSNWQLGTQLACLEVMHPILAYDCSSWHCHELSSCIGSLTVCYRRFAVSDWPDDPDACTPSPLISSPEDGLTRRLCHEFHMDHPTICLPFIQAEHHLRPLPFLAFAPAGLEGIWGLAGAPAGGVGRLL